MACPHRQSAETSMRPGTTSLGYCRFVCRACGGRFNERTGTPFNDLAATAPRARAAPPPGRIRQLNAGRTKLWERPVRAEQPDLDVHRPRSTLSRGAWRMPTGAASTIGWWVGAFHGENRLGMGVRTQRLD